MSAATSATAGAATPMTSPAARRSAPARSAASRRPQPTLLTDVTVAGPAFAVAGTANIDGAVAGGQIGYNWQTGAWVFGLETDLQWTGQRGSTSFCLTAGCPAGSFVANADYKLQWFGTARARAGWLVDPRVLLYVTGGAAYGQVKADYTGRRLGLPLGGSSTSTTRLGWTVGGGIEGMLSENWTVKAEYLYVDLGTSRAARSAAPRRRSSRTSRRRPSRRSSTRRSPRRRARAYATTSPASASTITSAPVPVVARY